MKFIGILIIIMFYSIYFGKMLIQRKAGIKTDQLGKSRKSKRIFYFESFMKIGTYFIVLVQFFSIMICEDVSVDRGITGICLGFIACIIFLMSVVTMKNSWRAGIAENDKTELITEGIYGFSRNPAFLAFDLMYIGILVMFFNWTLFVFTIIMIIMFHLQILNEEKYLKSVFKDEYLEYMGSVRRYL